MKKAIFSLLIAGSLLTTAGMLFGEPATTTSCWEQVFARWNTCDAAYSVTMYNKLNETAMCQSIAAGVNPNTQSPEYINAYNACITNVDNAFDGRANTYGSCLSPEGQGSNCIEEIADKCLDARDRWDACSSIYANDGDAAYACQVASGYDMCR
jgi:hypothetical protein